MNGTYLFEQSSKSIFRYLVRVSHSQPLSEVKLALVMSNMHSDCCSPCGILQTNLGVVVPSSPKRIFPSQGSNPALPLCRWILCQPHEQREAKNTGVSSLSFSRNLPQQSDNVASWGSYLSKEYELQTLYVPGIYLF